uniref:C2H2-type domain-containing protein n=1 Tax=Timema genevievae TaxID=629358 RepID=A0A7R9PQJ9_TIMGE|nr:unnamed protein product [Timema genevievae]
MTGLDVVNIKGSSVPMSCSSYEYENHAGMAWPNGNLWEMMYSDFYKNIFAVFLAYRIHEPLFPPCFGCFDHPFYMTSNGVRKALPINTTGATPVRRFHLLMRIIKTYHQTILLSIVGYGACLRAHRLNNVVPNRAIGGIQMNILLRLSGSYWTVATDALIVTLGKNKLEKVTILTSLEVNNAWEAELLAEWQRRWEERETGRRTFQLFPNVLERLKNEHPGNTSERRGNKWPKFYGHELGPGRPVRLMGPEGDWGCPSYLKNQLYSRKKPLRRDSTRTQERTLSRLIPSLGNKRKGLIQLGLLGQDGKRRLFGSPLVTIGLSVHFEEEVEPLDNYLERLELVFLVNKTEEVEKVPLLLTRVGPKTYELLKNHLMPEAPKDKSYEQLRMVFNQRLQAEFETVAQYIVEIKILAASCDFGAFLKDALLDRLISGLRDRTIQCQLAREKILKFEEVCEMAGCLDLANDQLKSFHKVEPNSMHFVGKKGKDRQTYQTSSSCSLGKDVRKSPYFWPPYPLIGSKDEAIKNPTFWPPNLCVMSKEDIKEREQFLSPSPKVASSLREGLKEAEHFELPQVTSSSREGLREDGSFEISRVTSLLRGELREATPFETHHARHPPGESKELHDLKTLQLGWRESWSSSVLCGSTGNSSDSRLCEVVYTSDDDGKTADSRSPRRFICPTCGKLFAAGGNLRTHQRTHSGEKPYKCEFCQQPFSTVSNLKTHVRTHTKEKPYLCDQCHVRFATSSNLKVHYRMHTGERPYQCNQCGREFTGRFLHHGCTIETLENSSYPPDKF